MPASTKDMICNSFNPSDHLGGCTTRERQEHESSGIGPIYDEVCDTMSQGVGLTRARPRYDEERRGSFAGRRTTVFYGSALFRIEHSEIEAGHGRGANHLCSISLRYHELSPPRPRATGSGCFRFFRPLDSAKQGYCSSRRTFAGRLMVSRGTLVSG